MPATTDRKLRVFLCHSSQDKPIVRKLYQRLNSEGWIDPWLDEEKLLPGQNWVLEINKAVKSSDIVIVCLSNNSVTREGFVQKELKNILDVSDNKPEGTIFVVPVRLDEVKPPERFKSLQYVDYFPKDREDWAFRRILKSVEIHPNSGSALRGEVWFKNLTKSEAQILLLVSKGLTNKQISENLHLGDGKVRNYVSSILEKLKASNRSEAAAYAHKHKLEEFLSSTNIPPVPPIQVEKKTLGDIEFVKIPAGKFQMGNNHNNESFPLHNVDLPYDYWIGRFPITNAQYFKFLLENNLSLSGLTIEFHTGLLIKALWHRVKLDRLLKTSLNKKDLLPVSGVSFVDAQEFTLWLNKKYKDQLPEGYQFCLPSEAEWEKAARGVEDSRNYPWGDQFDIAKCNAGGLKKGRTNIGSYSNTGGDSPYQVADMSGNVWEWTRSIFKKYPYKLDNQLVVDIEKLTLIDNIILRGGSWLDKGIVVQITNRSNYWSPKSVKSNFGFRVALCQPPSKNRMSQ